ncbi:MAG: VWA domain-containing protein [Vallitaleaceae bacterium]|jgi:hypothetical protein|nr:VWA domain-containing protein [Vallitaleaceae bacterium]
MKKMIKTGMSGKKIVSKTNQLKTLVSLALVIVLVLSTTACQNKEDTADTKDEGTISNEITTDLPEASRDESATSESSAVGKSDEDTSYMDTTDSMDAAEAVSTSDSVSETTYSDTTQPEIRPEPQYGQLTAGEWNDNENFDYFKNVINNNDWYDMQAHWGFTNWERYEITVMNEEDRVISGATVIFYDEQGQVYYQIMTDNKGVAYAFPYINQEEDIQNTVNLKVEYNGETYDFGDASDISGDNQYKLVIPQNATRNSDVDIMFVIDTTGSMADELAYLKKEIQNVVTEVQNQNANNLNIRLSINYYRDETDEYVVRSYPFTTDIDAVVEQIGNQWSDGGGDYEEAVETALMDGITGHNWNVDAGSKLLFLVLDAPPHHNDNTLTTLEQIVSLTSEMGIKIIPVASSGVDKETEFLLRFLSLTTGGTYVFLTDDSGIGGSHLEPTIGDYQVEYLNDLLVRLINGYIQ